MKILGENSLSSKVIIGLNVLSGIISIVDILVASIIVKIISHIIMQENLYNNIFDLIVYTMIIITGIMALFIIFQFIKIFKNLKANVLFCQDNSKRLNIVSNSCFIISAIYLIIAILIFSIISNLNETFIYYISAFSIMFTVIFIISGVGIKILNEIYKKAIEYKEDSDFTI